MRKIRDLYLTLQRKKEIRILNNLIPVEQSIFSMNCIAGRIYQDLKRPYNTPTAGLFFLPEDFIKIGMDITVINSDIEEIQLSKWKGAKEVERHHGKYPIGRFVGTDIEIHFLHYPTFEEAVNKWKRRTSRFNFNNYLLIALCQNGWENYESYFSDFKKLSHNQKVLFTNLMPSGGDSNIISIEGCKNLKDSPDPYKKAKSYYRALIKYLTSYNK